MDSDYVEASLNLITAGASQELPIFSSGLRVKPKRSRNPVRPSTAPASDDKIPLLPADGLGGRTLSASSSFTKSADNLFEDRSPGATNSSQENLSDAEAEGKPALRSVRVDTATELGDLPSPFARDRISTDMPNLQRSVSVESETIESDYDWAAFINAYASGRWDPRRTPNPPRSHVAPASNIVFSNPGSVASFTHAKAIDSAVSTIAHHEVESVQLSASRINVILPLNAPSPSQTSPLSTPRDGVSSWSPSKAAESSIPRASRMETETSSQPRTRTKMNLNLPFMPPTHISRNSSPSRLDLLDSKSTGSSSGSDVTTTAATLRWAAARVNIAPLTLPSPEHELTDPMRGVTAAIPGSYPPERSRNAPKTPRETFKSQLGNFWEGTQDVDADEFTTAVNTPHYLEPLVEENTGTSGTSGTSITSRSSRSSGLSEFSKGIPWHGAPVLVSAPALSMSDSPKADYFDHRHTPSEDLTQCTPLPSLLRRSSSPLNQYTNSAPPISQRATLTRQSSSPLPGSSSRFETTAEERVTTDAVTAIKVGQAAKEEQMFGSLGYLAAPQPPDELERRRAMYKYNIWHTASDINFDRIAHLAKLVFNTKAVFISLIDGNEQWFKSECNWKPTQPWEFERQTSFCAHTILQRGDEPTVVLDAEKDWRFAKNPFVTGSARIRFYAGAPLRTQDGFNIGSLCVVDDNTREDFSPRQRHTLKEFAAIAMREMELWRDKIQLRIRDRIQSSMEEFSRECLEIDTLAQSHSESPDRVLSSTMDKVYDRAAKLVKRTLDVEGVIVMDVSHCEVLETMNSEGSVSVVMHSGAPDVGPVTRSLSTEEYAKLNSFFAQNPDGKISEGVVPPSFRPFLPTHIQYALIVPIFNVDKRPFALLCAYNSTDHTNRFLEGHELSYLRAIGVIILSAVLKRRMLLADKAKSLFISNISHELRTPLHGILAASELLAEGPLNHNQTSFLQTVQACGTSLVETVNHVLDFTKLSGNSKAGGVENFIVPTTVDLMQLVEEAVDGSWIGHRARMSIMGKSEIGSVYSPPGEGGKTPEIPAQRQWVETVVDIGYREGGWVLNCEKGGIRRVLMNLFGNSLKFTTDGFVHVSLRQLPRSEDMPPNKVKVELIVHDTGKGISQNFLKNQLFHPFSQENPLQTGTGLGLAIVNSIVQSESVDGKVDVWSEEGVGTEIKVTFMAESLPETDSTSSVMAPLTLHSYTDGPTVSLVGFNLQHKGDHLLHDVLSEYLVSWWGFQIQPEDEEYGDIIIVNNDLYPVVRATERKDLTRPFIVLSSSRGNSKVVAIATEYERIGGFCRIIYKPGGPSRLRPVLKMCLHALEISRNSRRGSTAGLEDTVETHLGPEVKVSDEWGVIGSTIPRRNSEERNSWPRTSHVRPSMATRASTINPLTSVRSDLPSTFETDESTNDPPSPEQDEELIETPTVPIGSGGSLLKSSMGLVDKKKPQFRILVIEDNKILRDLLSKWLRNKGYDHRDAVDGQQGVDIFEAEKPFDIVLLDMSMPILDGIGASREIRRIESERATLNKDGVAHRTQIIALTGMSSLDDKRKAFDAGVDGYLVKPVAFKTLDDMFHKLGIL